MLVFAIISISILIGMIKNDTQWSFQKQVGYLNSKFNGNNISLPAEHMTYTGVIQKMWKCRQLLQASQMTIDHSIIKEDEGKVLPLEINTTELGSTLTSTIF